jgi:general secretion pathway protein I
MCAKKDPERGFTLVEALVALGVFATAAVSLIALQTQTTQVAVALQTQSTAQIVANTLMVELSVSATPPPVGTQRGQTEALGRTWAYTIETALSPDPALLRVQVLVHSDVNEGPDADLIGFVAVSAGGS